MAMLDYKKSALSNRDIYRILHFFSLCSHGEATGGPEAAAGKTMSDQPGAAEAQYRPG